VAWERGPRRRRLARQLDVEGGRLAWQTEEIFDLSIESTRDAQRDIHGGRRATGLDRADALAHETRPLGEADLRQAATLAKLTNTIGWRHDTYSLHHGMHSLQWIPCVGRSALGV
jgi:hypothetical protein